MNLFEYTKKFDSYSNKTLFEKLPEDQQFFIKDLSFKLLLTFQEFRWICEQSRDLEMWDDDDFATLWQRHCGTAKKWSHENKKALLALFRDFMKELRRQAKSYDEESAASLKYRMIKPEIVRDSPVKIFGQCPVASPRTICCQLYTMDPVMMCPFGCSYCTIQTFYNPKITIHDKIRQKFDAIKLNPKRFYHIGTGQASDSLVFGNINGLFDELCRFARRHPNVLLELKTKSNRVDYFLGKKVPWNIVISWSLNPERIIQNEEHFTASLADRLKVARKVADQGIAVAFHFHPMIYYDRWDEEYPIIAERILGMFSSEETAFISMGSVTLIKPVIRKIRETGMRTKILQMEMVPDPHGKMTYPDHIKIKMFKTMYQAFQKWHSDVLLYLCMEKRSIWEGALGFSFEDGPALEQAFAVDVMRKLKGRK